MRKEICARRSGQCRTIDSIPKRELLRSFQNRRAANSGSIIFQHQRHRKGFDTLQHWFPIRINTAARTSLTKQNIHQSIHIVTGKTTSWIEKQSRASRGKETLRRDHGLFSNATPSFRTIRAFTIQIKR